MKKLAWLCVALLVFVVSGCPQPQGGSKSTPGTGGSSAPAGGTGGGAAPSQPENK